MSQEMDDLVTAVAAEDSVIASAVVAFTGLAAKIADAAGDQAKSLALSADVTAQAAALAAAIPAGTPAAVVVGATGAAGPT